MFLSDVDALRRRDNAKWSSTEPGVIPAWVADMDVEVPPVVAARMRSMIASADLGYPTWPEIDPLIEVFERRMQTRFGWTPQPGRGRLFTDVIQAFQVAIELRTEPGDGIALHVPAYPMFLRAISDAGRRVVPIPPDADASELARHWRDAGVTMLVIVNPHNPTGHVFTAAELALLAEAASELDLPVISDEIHADLIFDGRAHVPFALLSADAAERTTTLTSASKAFNLPGLHCAVAHVGDRRLADAMALLPEAYFGGPSTVSRAASLTAWTEGDPWLAALVDALTSNRDTVAAWAAEAGVGLAPIEASYLAWLDFSQTPIAADPAGVIHDRGRVRLSPGVDFTEHTPRDSTSFARLNFGTSPVLLDQILDRIGSVLS